MGVRSCPVRSCGHPGSAQMRSVRMPTVVPSGTLISVGSRVRALVRLLADPPLLGTMGSWALFPAPMAGQTGGEGDQRGHGPTRESSEVARRDPVDRHQMRGEGHDMTDSAGSGSSDRSASGVIPTVPEAFDRLDISLLEAMMTQRAVRRVLPDPVNEAIVLKCIELGLRAPTGSNSQNWEFVVVKDQGSGHSGCGVRSCS